MSADDERDEMDDFNLHIHRQLAKMDDNCLGFLAKMDELKAQTRPKPPERDEMDDFILHIHRQLAKMDDKLDELKAQTRPKPPRPTILK